jgi:chromosome segregation ATPase
VEDIADLVRRKKLLLYDINCIREYMETWESHSYYHDMCEQMKREVEEINRRLEGYYRSPCEDFERQRSELLQRIQNHERELQTCKRKLREIDEIIVTVNVSYGGTLLVK